MMARIVPLFVILFALFPLTDTDIWWHLACAREWYLTWTPVRLPVVNVHEYFQQAVYAVYSLGGAPLLVVFKALLWGMVFALFLRPKKISAVSLSVSVLLLFLFRFQFEMRPVVFSMLFLGIYWNVLPWLFRRFLAGGWRDTRWCVKTVLVSLLVFALQWAWCRVQGLYVLGPLFAVACLVPELYGRRVFQKETVAKFALPVLFAVLLFAMPFLHDDGVALFMYPFGLLDRLLGLTPSAVAFAQGIAENRSPLTLALAGENALVSVLMLCTTVAGFVLAVVDVVRTRKISACDITLFVTAVMALIAERNFVLFLPVFVGVVCSHDVLCKANLFCKLSNAPRVRLVVGTVLVFAVLGFWCRGVVAYDSWVAYQRVPVGAVTWMKAHPHEGRLFNDDRAGGYLAFVNPADSIYIDGRFILKTADFFERYLRYAGDPKLFMADADSLGVDRAVFPVRFYARWGSLLGALDGSPEWEIGYVDDFYIVFCKK